MANGYVGIPTSYTPVEYIESSGTQYIDTGVIPTSTTKLEFNANIVSGDSNVWMPVFGSRSFNSSNNVPATYFCLYIQTSSHYLSPNYAGFDPGTGGNTKINFNQRYKLTEDKGQFYIDDVLQSGISTTNTLTTGDKTIYLFTNNSLGDVQQRGQDVKLYNCKIWNNNILVRDFIPALDENNVACLYEQVEDKLYYNKGAGTFTVGSETGQPVSLGNRAKKIVAGYVGVPASYTPVEYIESSGTQYIDTGVIPYQTQTKIKFAQVDTTGSSNNGICAGWDANNNRYYAVYAVLSGSPKHFSSYMKDGTEIVLQNSMDTNDHVVIYNDGNNKVLFDGVEKGTVTDLSAGGTKSIYLFGANWEAGASILATSRIYYCQITDKTTNTLIRDFIPALDDNNVACLYEQVEGKFYYNVGAGTFAAGSATGQPVSLGGRARKIIKGYIGVNGVARLCFGSLIPRHTRSIMGETTQSFWPTLAGTADYILVMGGGQTISSTPVKTVKAYNKNGTSISAPDLTTQSWYGTGGNFNGYAIYTSGKSASSGSSRTNQCLSYDNNLTKGTLTTSKDVFEASFAANSTHFMIAGGTNYNSHQNWICSYDSSFVKTTPTAMSTYRRCNSSAPIGDYIACCGGLPNYGAVDFYDNSNVRTTSTNPYGSKSTYYPLGLGTRNYVIFFGGSTSSSASNAYSDVKAYDNNKVLTSFSLPVAMYKAQGFSTGDYACIYYGLNEYIYDDNLVLVNSASTGNYGSSEGMLAAKSSNFAIEQQNGSALLNIFDI